MSTHRVQVLSLFRRLLRYSNELVLTDQDYYRRRVRAEFDSNKNATDKVSSKLIQVGRWTCFFTTGDLSEVIESEIWIGWM